MQLGTTQLTLASGVRALDDRAFAALVHAAPELLVVESYHAGWEKPWRALADSDWHVFEREFGERVCCATLETGANRETAQRHGLEIIPQVLVFLGGERVARFSGNVGSDLVVVAVHAALERSRAIEDGLRELAAAPRPTLLPMRPMLRPLLSSSSSQAPERDLVCAS